MLKFQTIQNVSEINTPANWVDAPKFNCKNRIVEKDGRRYQIIAKKEHIYSKRELATRRFLATLAAVCTLGLALLSSKIWDLFMKTKECRRFAIPYTPPTKPIETVKPVVTQKEIKLRGGITNYDAFTCYFSSTLQCLAGLPGRDLLTQGTSKTAIFFKKIFSALDAGKTIPVTTTKKWIEEAKTLNLLKMDKDGVTHFEIGSHGDPADVVNNVLENKESGIFKIRNGKEFPSPHQLQFSISNIPQSYSLQSIVDGKIPVYKPLMVKSQETSPSFVAINIGGRSTASSYDSKPIETPHKLTLQSTDGSKVEYALKSAIVFQGNSSKGANHYYTYELSPKKSDAPVWIEYNDSYVQEHVDHDKKIQNMLEQRGYIFFYTKV